MKLTDLLSGKRPAVLKRWLDVTVETYPSGAPIFLKKQKSRFSNPVVYTVSQGIELILDELLQETDFDKISPFLDSIIRIKAVQGLPPSQAIAFVFKLKNVIREAVGS
ncbi:MAG: RsbRD N-terminal domain-containing protein, partial [Nitrospirae bacterium]|nr:RsbRD N-terminal domain-containing protein [Nitrospirota bacterium]